MLDGYQIQTVAYTTSYDELICEDCARRIIESCGAADDAVGGILDALRLGILDAGKVPLSSPISRYEMNEHHAALAADDAYCEVEGVVEDDPDTWQPVCCDDCGSELTE